MQMSGAAAGALERLGSPDFGIVSRGERMIKGKVGDAAALIPPRGVPPTCFLGLLEVMFAFIFPCIRADHGAAAAPRPPARDRG